MYVFLLVRLFYAPYPEEGMRNGNVGGLFGEVHSEIRSAI